jgi:hypothetical protein
MQYISFVILHTKVTQPRLNCLHIYAYCLGIWPENFPCGYEPHIMDMLVHPQMLELHRRMLGDDIRFDHNVALNRRGGYPGGGWHSHPYVEDEMGPTDRPPSLGLVRTLAYPEGFGAREDGGVKLVPGSHLHRCSEVEPGRWKYPDPQNASILGSKKTGV